MNSYQEKFRVYEDLLLTYDHLKKRAEQIWRAYMRRFGDLIEKSYLANLECIKLKKKIAYCQSMKNAGREVRKLEMESFVDIEMSEYYDELEMIIETKKEPTAFVSAYEYEKIKKTYRSIATMIHPDLNGGVFSEELAQLWEQVKKAYRGNDYDGLIALSVLVSREMEKFSKQREEIEIENIDGLIMGVRDMINEVVYSEPYIYKDLLDDEEKSKTKERMLGDEITMYTEYANELRAKLETYEIKEAYCE